jgi:hypothetical protein
MQNWFLVDVRLSIGLHIIIIIIIIVVVVVVTTVFAPTKSLSELLRN